MPMPPATSSGRRAYVDHSLGHAADERALEASPAARAQDNEIGVDTLS